MPLCPEVRGSLLMRGYMAKGRMRISFRGAMLLRGVSVWLEADLAAWQEKVYFP